jgi:hypothetical protein
MEININFFEDRIKPTQDSDEVMPIFNSYSEFSDWFYSKYPELFEKYVAPEPES